MMNYNISNAGYREHLHYEGVSVTKYLCSQNEETIGAGFTKSDIPDLHAWSWDREMPVEETMRRFPNAVKKYADAVNKGLKVPVKQTQFDALVSICYNIGINGFSGSTFLKHINNGKDLDTIRKAIMMWTANPELKKRRTNEANLFCNGIYTNNGTCLQFNVNKTTHKPSYKNSTVINTRQYFS